MVPIDRVVELCLSQAGKPYRLGYEVRLTDPNPPAFDCSELIQWACYQACVMPAMLDGSMWQLKHCQQHQTDITVDEGVATRGALLFIKRPAGAISHVAMSLGGGRTIEARSTAYGVGSFTSVNRGWTHAARIPGCDYTPVVPHPHPTEPPVEGEDDMLLCIGDGPGRAPGPDETDADQTGNGWAWVALVNGKKRWVRADEAEVLGQLGRRPSVVTQSALDRLDWV